MKAAYYHGNKTIQVGESVPHKPGPGEVRIHVAYCGVCGTDLHIFKGGMDKRVSMPQVIGHEMSGDIAEIGPQVKGWSLGDRVVVRPLQPCGNCPACKAGHAHVCYNLKFLGIDTPGAFQGSWTVPAHTLHRMPPNLSFDLGALIEPVAVACHDIRRGELKAGEEAVVIGGGPIGLLVALVAKQAGARVLLSEVNPYRLNLAREVGLEVVNPKEADLNEFVSKRTNGTGADVVFEVTGTAPGAAVMTQLVRVRGRIVIVGVFGDPPKVDLFRFFWRELHLCGARVYEPEDFEKAIDLAARGVFPLARLISARWPVTELQKAFEQIEAGTDLMKVLIDTRGE
jgi:(R,R)-butanediol dehydrogenase/meso-butanediol dehydrogenase/diacetyl reductase